MEIVPREEITGRATKLGQLMAEAGLGLALIRQPADLFYYTGTIVEGFLAAPAAGDPRLLVRRPKERPAVGDTPWEVVFYADLKELPGLLADLLPAPDVPLGLELDVLPAFLYLRLREKVFPKAALTDVSPLIRRQRMVKSAYELAQIRRASAMLDQVFQEAPGFLRLGMSELELAAEVEYRLRLLGHQGLVRLRRWDMEMFYGHVMSGEAGLAAAYIDTPTGGLGFSPAFPQGASRKVLAPGEPISIDVAGCVNGYMADMTRLYAIGDLVPEAWRAYELIQELYRVFESETRAGALSSRVYDLLAGEVRRRGLEDCFMGQGADRVSFLGHGLGLELDELPLLTARSPFSFEADMVMAFEPKLFLPGIGMVGQEDTCRITPDGVEWLTLTPRRVFIV